MKKHPLRIFQNFSFERSALGLYGKNLFLDGFPEANFIGPQVRTNRVLKLALVIVFFALCAASLPAQSNDGEPVLNPDIMTYFQGEMTSFMRYQSRLEYNTPFYLSSRFHVVVMEEEEKGTSSGLLEGVGNANGNFLIGGQIKINDLFYIPVFAAFAGSFWAGEPDEGTLVIDGQIVDGQYSYAGIAEYNGSCLFGGGLFFNGKAFKGGVFAGYNIKHRISGVDLQETWRSTSPNYRQNENDYTRSFKIALLPLVDTSGWRYVGRVLDSALGYIGMGDLVDVYAGEEKSSAADSIFRALNYGLNLAFKNLEFNAATLGFEGIYRRDNYDIIAKNDTYGAALTLKAAFGSFAFMLKPELGFKHFYSVSKYFTSKYPDTPYCDIGLSFIFDKSSLKLYYRYDEIIHSSFGVTFDVRNALSLLFDIGAHGSEYTTEEGKTMDKTAATRGAGIRYRYGGIMGPKI
jgi:hypothetical protein